MNAPLPTVRVGTPPGGGTSTYLYIDRHVEQALARRFRDTGDRAAADRLAKAHLRLVALLARKYRHYGVPIVDLVAEGNCGLVLALGKFDPERGVRFATYAAHWVRSRMLEYVIRARSIVAGSSGPLRTQVFFRLRREWARATALYVDVEQAQAEVAHRMGTSRARVAEMLRRLDAQDLSFDASPFDDALSCGSASAELSTTPEELLSELRFKRQLELVLGRVLAVLDRREREIVRRRFMSESGNVVSLAEIARSFGISRERARQLEVRALKKLREAIGETNRLG